MTSVIPVPKAVVFDWDNTLVDSWACIRESYNMTFRHFGMPEWSLEECKVNVAKSLRDSFPSLFGERWEEARDVFYASFEAIHMSHLEPLPGAAAMLEDLAGRGVYLAVVSNKRGSFLRGEAAALGWTRFFGGLVGATDAEADKPHPSPVRMALAPGGFDPGPDVWFVGDAAIDMECGHASGCTPVLMRTDPPRVGEFGSYPPVCHLDGCRSIVALVRELAVPISGI
ncbi:MAG: HAD family hydrolase [Pseudomonadota bacterium]